MEHLSNSTGIMSMPVLLLVGLMIVIGYYLGHNMRFIKLPTIIGYMIFGVVLGPSIFNAISDHIQGDLGFITNIALGFVALSIGLELKFSTLKKFGRSMIYIILLESFGAFLIVFIGVYLVTKNIPLAIIFGAIAPASAPAGTVAVIHEFRAKGPLTKALYTVVGFDDGLGIIIFGFAAAIARGIFMRETGAGADHIWAMILHPLKEILLSIVFGIFFGLLFSILGKRIKHKNDMLILVFGFVFITCGICEIFHISLIFTNMVIGMFLVNSQPHSMLQKIHDRLPVIMPLLFILFFTLAGANLHLGALPSLGVLGVVYVICRTVGLVGGSRLGAIVGKADDVIKNYIGLGILSQAGVAIGLALIVKQDFQGLGKTLESGITSGDNLGTIVLTTVTVTCIFFELIGPILTKYALLKAGEINRK